MDKDQRWHKTDETGRNKIGYVTQQDIVIYPYKTKIRQQPLAALRKKALRALQVNVTTPDLENRIESFFVNNVPNPILFAGGIKALVRGDHSVFDSPILLPKLQKHSPEEHEQRWKECVSILLPGDFIQVLDTGSLVSRLIAKIDRGTWSHSASYLGNGRLAEAITAGVVERDIDVYRAPRYRIGIYRADISREQADRMGALQRAQIGKPYAWRRVFMIARSKICSYLGFCEDAFPADTPNGLVLRLKCRLVFVV